MQAGQRLGVFEVLGPVGAGGMGEVWRGRDTRIGREVALKTLPGAIAQDSGRVERLRKEARLLGSLSHPHIATLFALEECDAATFLVMELVQGRTLAERLGAGPVPVPEALDLARQIADGLEAAHERGVLHRDLKPSNIAIDTKGQVKLLDFGLAKAIYESEPTDSKLATASAPLTDPGAVVGTAPYMSPEQARGAVVDRRTDVWAFGCVLYEMLAGKRAFPGAGAEALAAILEREPDWSALPAGTPAGVHRLLRHCLTKDARERLPDIVDAGLELEAAGRERASDLRHPSAEGRPVWRRPAALVALAVLASLAWLSFAAWKRGAQRRWAREEALPEIERLAEESWRDYSAAYALVLEAEKHIPGDPRLAELISRCSRRISITTEPPGAQVYVKGYAEPAADWEHLGASPLEDVRLPIGVMRWKIEKPGYETVLAASSTWDVSLQEGDLLVPNDLFRVLDEEGAVPTGMVRVLGFETEVGRLQDFYVDRHEVTNRQYQEFVDAGGYRTRKHWKHAFEDGGDGGRTSSWEQAMSRFVDRTQRPGPATWLGSAYPEGTADHPVSGISWYEAAAYADFAGKVLPTGHHWGLARGEATTLIRWPQLGGYALFAPFSNFDGRGPREVGSLPGITAFGAYDMAGNVREWCSNATEGGRLIRGGSWSDTTYMFSNLSQLPPMDRSPQNGFRCASYPRPEQVPAAALAKIELPGTRDFYAETAVSDEVFGVFKERFAYDRSDLGARIESRRDGEHWSVETVGYDAAYGRERVLAHLFLPRNAAPPYQTVVYFPGSGSMFQKSSARIEEYFEFPVFLSYLVKNGRAVLYPVYAGTFERADPALIALEADVGSHRYAEYVVQLVKDVRRSIDYLETRPDVDAERLAFYGMSWGGWLGPIVTAVEDRIAASVLVSGGLRPHAFRPETDPVNYLPRVRVPTLMINGRYDMLFPLEQSIRPMFDRLGPPDGHKELLLSETDHIPARNDLIRGTLAWLDRYFGPVRSES